MATAVYFNINVISIFLKSVVRQYFWASVTDLQAGGHQIVKECSPQLKLLLRKVIPWNFEILEEILEEGHQSMEQILSFTFSE